MRSLNSLIVDSTTLVTVTWSAAIHVIRQTPVLWLKRKEKKHYVIQTAHILV